MKACLLVQKKYLPGSLPPDGYLEWHEWADVQRKAGIKQVECGMCGKWKTPQELSGQVAQFSARDKRGKPVTLSAPVCSECAA